MTRKILDAAAKNVQHFCQLHTVLVEKLLEGIGLTAGIDCYLGSLRDLLDEQYDDYCHQQEGELLVPRELVGLLRRARCVNPNRSEVVNNSDRMRYSDPHIRIAHDGISHRIPTTTAN